MNTINKRSILEEMKQMAWHNVLCCSANYGMTEPKDGMREEWEQAVAKAKIVDTMLDELPGHPQYDEIMKTQRYYRKYVGHFAAWSCDVTKTEDPHPYISLVEFALDGFGISDSDTRLFHINHELGVRESWNEIYKGSNNGSRVAVLEEGLQFKQIAIPPEQSQFLQTRKFQLNEIARIFRIPPHMIGDLEKSSFSNIEQQSLEYVKYTLDPWAVRWEQAMQKALLLPSEKLDCLHL